VGECGLGRSPLVGVLKPTPKGLSGQRGGKEPKQGNRGKERNTTTAESRPKEEGENKANGQNQKRKDLSQQKH
jgi:hypothetical protein